MDAARWLKKIAIIIHDNKINSLFLFLNNINETDVLKTDLFT